MMMKDANPSLPSDAAAGDAGAGAAFVAIAEDILCMDCGYDLRGLSPDGRCPECSFGIQASLAKAAADRTAMGPPLWMSDRRWLTDLVEGAGLVVLLLVLLLVIALSPGSLWALGAPSRAWLLGLACTGWVVGWFASWKLASPDPNGAPRSTRWLRGSATLYLTLPFWWALASGSNPGVIWLIVFLIVLASGLVALIAHYVVLRDLAWRAGSRWLPVHATLLAMVGVIAFVMGTLMPRGHGSSDSLSMIMGLSVVQLGSAEHVRHVITMWRWGWPDPLEWIMLVSVLWPAGFAVRMLMLLLATRRRAEESATDSAAHGAGRAIV